MKKKVIKEKINILYEDADIVAIDKPAGILVHSDGRSGDKTLSDIFALKYKRSKNVGEDIVLEDGSIIKRSGVVHRLDKDTTGVILFAKTKKGFQHLKKQFKNHNIKKIYNAFVYGNPKNDRGIIDKPIGRDSRDFRQKTVQRDMRGVSREAITNYIVLFKNKDYAFIKAIPKTGRTHQIRVHLKSIGNPIVSDLLYAKKTKNSLGFNRTALHSKSVEFENTKGQIIKVEADFPEDFKTALEKIGYLHK